ncbi:MAG: thioredoxin family protein [Steroidobacteraceae bacterium]
MAAKESTMLTLGTLAPDFNLSDFDGKLFRLSDFNAASGLVVAFICCHCPFVVHVRTEFAQFARAYQAKGIAVVAINSNDLQAFPQDGPTGMRAEAQTIGYTFPYLLDETQAVAMAYQAACTPDIYLFDGARKLFYRGQFDASRPGSRIPVTGADLRAATDALLAGDPAPSAQRPSIGCSIKWKAGNEPVYA